MGKNTIFTGQPIYKNITWQIKKKILNSEETTKFERLSYEGAYAKASATAC